MERTERMDPLPIPSAPSAGIGRAARAPRDTRNLARARRWTVRVGRLFGIEVELHLSLLVVLAWVAVGPLAALSAG